MKQRARAIAIATLMLATGVSLSSGAATDATASSHNCPAVPDYLIADSPLPATSRTLDGNSEEFGMEEVLSGVSETLRVELLTPNDELEITVFHEDANGNCVKFNPSSCEATLTTQGQVGTCVLIAPSDGVKMYWLKAVNPQSDSLGYTAQSG